MVPVGVVAECVAIKSRLTEIVQTVEILRRELVVSPLVMAKLIAKLIVGERVVTCVCDTVAGNPPSITSHRVIVTEIMGGVVMTVAAPSMTHVGQASAASAPTVAAASATTTATLSGECRDVRHHAERAHRDTCRQNAYRSLLHGTFPTRSSKAVGVGGTRDIRTELAPSNIWLLWRSDDIMAGEREGKKERNR
jgi:hypothetical protein